MRIAFITVACLGLRVHTCRDFVIKVILFQPSALSPLLTHRLIRNVLFPRLEEASTEVRSLSPPRQGGLSVPGIPQYEYRHIPGSQVSSVPQSRHCY